MNKFLPLFILMCLLLVGIQLSAQSPLDAYIQNFNYETRKEMKVSSEQILDLVASKQAILVDIRFEEEQALWSVAFSRKIPLNQLEQEYVNLPKDKIIVTACPKKDRAIIAMMYLKSQGFEDVRYLSEGLLGLNGILKR